VPRWTGTRSLDAPTTDLGPTRRPPVRRVEASGRRFHLFPPSLWGRQLRDCRRRCDPPSFRWTRRRLTNGNRCTAQANRSPRNEMASLSESIDLLDIAAVVALALPRSASLQSNPHHSVFFSVAPSYTCVPLFTLLNSFVFVYIRGLYAANALRWS